MLLIILISSIITLFLFEEFRELLVDIIIMLIICVFVFAYSVCVFIVDYLYVFIDNYILSFFTSIFSIIKFILRCARNLFM
ncbi:hypothetical protein [Brachyspira alvinipulli]|uniref:hypothetical protein n=1 Tax=Brachyspira alvinipulli TaxID=84379 RepID=UPI0004B2A254|nr:hypothetical protein [Brachyspira alvinipulli]